MSLLYTAGLYQPAQSTCHWKNLPFPVFKSIPQIHDWKETKQFILGERVDKQLKRDVEGVNPRDSLPGPSVDNSNNIRHFALLLIFNADGIAQSV